MAALAAAEAVIPVSGQLNADIVSEALGGVKVPGRIEQVRTSPTIIIDGGHNVNAAEALRAAIEENYDFTQLVGVIAMMGDKQVEEYLGVLEPLLSHVVVTENSWRERVMSAKDLEQVAVRVFGRDRVTCEPDLPDAIQTAVNMVDAEDELGVGYGHGVLICGSFVTAGDARTMLKEHAPGRSGQAEGRTREPRGPHARRRRRGRVRGRRGRDRRSGPRRRRGFRHRRESDFADSDFGIFDVAKAQAELEQDAQAIVDKVSGGAKDES